MKKHNATKNKEVISFHSSEDWSVDEWQGLLASLSNIYNVFISMKILKQFNTTVKDRFDKITVAKILSEPGEFIDEEAKLKIHEIKIASPGTFSLIGNGDIIKEIRKIIVAIYQRKANNEKVLIENSIQEQVLIGEKLKNIKTYLEIMEKYPGFKVLRNEDQKDVINQLMHFNESCLKYSDKAKLIEKK